MSQSEKMRYEWDSINWRKVKRSVFKLQKRIYQASKTKNLKKVHKLQRLLLKSRNAKILATRNVTQVNRGKNTAGIDGVKSLSKIQRIKLFENLNFYDKCQPVRRIWIPKPGKTEKRPLGIPTINDRIKQALAKFALEPEWEAKFEPNSYGFRPARSSQDARMAIFNAIRRKNAYVLDADIKGCFDNINHQKLLDKLETFPKFRKTIKDWLKVGVLEGGIFQETTSGTPQGGVISPLLANVALHGLENETKNALSKHLFDYLKRRNGNASKAHSQMNLSIIRYADDFVIIHESREIVEKAKKFVDQWLKNIGLIFNEEKTKIIHTLNSNSVDGNVGFKFLGFWVRQYSTCYRKKGYITLIKPSVDSQKRQMQKIKKVLKEKPSIKQEEIIKILNPIILGWSNYYKSSVSSDVFSKIDNYMFERLWSWACKRHQNKGLRWIKRKYFGRHKNNIWRFKTYDGKLLRLHSETHIIRHVKVKGEKSPFDGDSEYWTKRVNRTKRLMMCNLDDVI